MNEEICRMLEWDTAFFGIGIARVTTVTLDQATLEAIELWLSQHRVRCVYYLADVHQTESIAHAQRVGFEYADCRITLTCELTGRPQPEYSADPTVRRATSEDLPQLRAIARISHGDSRFFTDRRFPPGKAASLFELWIEKELIEPDHAVFVTGSPGEPTGYITVVLDRAKTRASIGLFAIAPAARGQGWGRVLLAHAVGHSRQEGCRTISVVTQGRNFAAQQAYQKSGFRTANLQMWYHRWLEPEVARAARAAKNLNISARNE